MAKRKWMDISNYRRGEDKSEPKSVELLAGRFRIVVTRHRFAPDKWHLCCARLCIDFKTLESQALDFAKAEALRLVAKELRLTLAAIE